jgi:hypothetical protein
MPTTRTEQRPHWLDEAERSYLSLRRAWGGHDIVVTVFTYDDEPEDSPDGPRAGVHAMPRESTVFYERMALTEP